MSLYVLKEIMEHQVMEGMWAELVSRPSADLEGHVVQIRILENAGDRTRSDGKEFEASLLRIVDLTKNAAPVTFHPLQSEDFYEIPE